MNVELVGVIGAVVAAILALVQIRKAIEDRAAARRAAELRASTSPEQKVSLIVASAETAAVVLRGALERADAELRRKDEIIKLQEDRIASLERRVAELERAQRLSS